jgi:hypothetical protein
MHFHAVIAKAGSAFFTRNRLHLCGFLMTTMFFSSISHAQYARRITRGDVGWYNLFSTWGINSKLGLHVEYQWRRDNFIINWQQSLLRTGINYSPKPGALFRLGYAWIETYNYGEIPLNAFGKTFTEHRIFQMMQLMHKQGRFNLYHRFMNEQRFVGKYHSPASENEESFPLLNRMRYMFRVSMPLKSSEIPDKTPYLVFYNEIFIGFGKNVQANVFDQNRSGILIGYRYSKALNIEIGFFNQTLQFGRYVEGKNVFQINNGIMVNLYTYKSPQEKKEAR